MVTERENTNYKMQIALWKYWVAAGSMNAASRFAPIPFVDEAIEYRAKKLIVQKTIQAHQLEKIEQFESIYNNKGFTLRFLYRKFGSLARRLLTFPIRKLYRMVSAARGVPLDVATAVLLGRSLDRYLHEGKFEKRNSEISNPEAVSVFVKAFRRTVRGLDFQILSHLIAKIWQKKRAHEKPEKERKENLALNNDSSLNALFHEFDRKLDVNFMKAKELS